MIFDDPAGLQMAGFAFEPDQIASLIIRDGVQKKSLKSGPELQIRFEFLLWILAPFF